MLSAGGTTASASQSNLCRASHAASCAASTDAMQTAAALLLGAPASDSSIPENVQPLRRARTLKQACVRVKNIKVIELCFRLCKCRHMQGLAHLELAKLLLARLPSFPCPPLQHSGVSQDMRTPAAIATSTLQTTISNLRTNENMLCT